MVIFRILEFVHFRGIFDAILINLMTEITQQLFFGTTRAQITQ